MPQMGQSERCTVKTGKTVWINVDYSNPTAATLYKTAGEYIDTDDEDTFNALLANTKYEYTGNTP